MTQPHDPPASDALLARGRTHVRIGLGIVGAYAIAALLFAPRFMPGSRRAVLVTTIGCALGCVGFAWTLARGSLFARLLAVVGLFFSAGFAAMGLLIAVLNHDLFGVRLAALLVPLAIGFAMTWMTRPAQALHDARDVARRNRRQGRPLAEWRAAQEPTDA